MADGVGVRQVRRIFRGAIQSDAAMLWIRESREAWHIAARLTVANSGENLKEADAIEERIVEENEAVGARGDARMGRRQNLAKSRF
jgi:hypothetical protein